MWLWGHCTMVDSATMLSSSQVGFSLLLLFMWGGNSALNPACSLWQYYLRTVFRRTVTWGCQMFQLQKGQKAVLKGKKKKMHTMPESVLPQAHSGTNKDVVAHLHFHWLHGPKCKQTQLAEVFAPIKHSIRAFKGFTYCPRWFAPLHHEPLHSQLQNIICFLSLFIYTHAKLIHYSIFGGIYNPDEWKHTFCFVIGLEQTTFLYVSTQRCNSTKH